MKCTNPACRMYGRELAPGARFCGICGQVVAEASARTPAPAPTDTYGTRPERPYGTPPASTGTPAGGMRRRMPSEGMGIISTAVNRMPQGIALGVNERIVKQYKIGRYTFRAGSIDLIVTNKRVIRYEESRWMGMQNNVIDEINIDAVHGVSTRMCRSISVIGLIASLVLLIVGLIALFGNPFGYASPIQHTVGIVALLIMAIIIISSLKPSFVFSVSGSIGNPALDTVVNMRGRLFRHDSGSVVFQFKPTAETTEMLKEIGACIYDLKTLGDAAIEKWS